MAQKPLQAKSWSYSRFGTYVQCPLKFKLGALMKIQEPKNAAMQRGNDIHKIAEDWINGKIPRMPKELKEFADLFKHLKAKKKKEPSAVLVEDQWGFTQDWGPADWFDWTGCWLRIKMDCAERTDNVIVVNDWKTGKFRDDNRADYLEQLELYALGVLLMFGKTVPDLIVRPRLVYLDHGIFYPRPMDGVIEYTLKDLPRLKKEWEKRVKPMLMDKTFAPKPNRWCSYCFYRKDNKANGGGQCPY